MNAAGGDLGEAAAHGLGRRVLEMEVVATVGGEKGSSGATGDGSSVVEMKMGWGGAQDGTPGVGGNSWVEELGRKISPPERR